MKVKGFKNYRNESWKAKQFLFRKSDRCGICGGTFKNMSDATVDHIVPVSLGGRDTPDNMQLAHSECNQRKANKLTI